MEEGDAVSRDVLAQAHARIRSEDLGEQPPARLEWLVEQGPTIDMEQVEHLVHERVSTGAATPAADGGLEPGEVGFAVVVEGDDLTVDDGRPGRDPGRWLQERPEVARRVLLATRPQPNVVVIDHGFDPESVPFDLEAPARVVERGRHEGRQHRRDERRQRRAAAGRRAASGRHDQGVDRRGLAVVIARSLGILPATVPGCMDRRMCR